MSPVWEENCRRPAPGMCVAGPGQDISMLQPIWYTPWFSQELWKYIQLRTVSGCNVNIHYSPFLEHYLSPKSQGRVILWFSPDTKYVESLPTAPNSPNTHWMCNKSIYIWRESMELLPILQVEGWKLLSSDGSHEVPSQSCLWPNN